MKAAKRGKQSRSMALVLVDGTAVRRQIKRDYEKAVRELAKARQELDAFKEQDVPQFSRWVSTEFGALLTELRETSHRLQDFDRKLHEMEREVVFGGVSPGRAYQRVMNRHRKEADDSTEEEPHAEHEGNSHYQSKAGPEFFEPRKEHKGRDIGGRLKELYRAVVRRLHPDTQEKLTPKKLEWWHEAQAAYEKGDVEQLEVILTLCEIDEAGSVEKASLSVLQRITAQFKSSLREIRRQLSNCKHDPAWRFSSRKDRKALAATMKRKLTADLELMHRELEMMEEQLAAWAAEAKRPRRPTYYRRRVVDPFESLF